MPWCPKCKNEYREGFTVCTDCGSGLISDEEYHKQLVWEKRRTEKEEAAEGQEAVEKKETAENQESGQGLLYQDNSQRASENRSAAWALLILGTVGLVILVLGVTGVIPTKLANSYLFCGVMGAIFILFLVAGVISMRNAKIFAGKAESENSLKSTLLEWCGEKLRAEEIDREIGADDSDSAEELYFKRFEYIRARLNHQFVNLNQGFLEKFIDDCVYGLIFEDEKA